MESAIRCSWPVHEGGYEWVTSPDEQGTPQRVLVPANASEPPRLRWSHPLEEEPGLFRAFGGLEAEDPIRRFADSHGLLAIGWFALPNSKGHDILPVQGVTLEQWRQAVLGMREAIDLWHAVLSFNAASLAQWFSVEEGRGRYHWPSLENTERVEWIPGLREQAPEKIDPLRLRELARNQLQHRVERWIGDVAMHFEFDRGTERPVLYLGPSSLYAAMWLQLVDWMAGGYDFRQCSQCGRWFVISPGTARSDKTFCGDPCRFKAYRARKKERPK